MKWCATRAALEASKIAAVALECNFNLNAG